MRRHKKTQRGVILLIVLGMLAMFALIGITFVLLSSHARRSAASQAKKGQANNPPERQANNVIQQILRGSNNPASVIGPHNLLEDLYGNNGTLGSIVPQAPPTPTVGVVVTGGQLLRFEYNATLTRPLSRVGCVLTMITGPAAGQSTRIVGCDPTNNIFQILAFEDISPATLINDIDTYISAGGSISYVINGTPFSGTGFGYNSDAVSTGPLLNAVDPDVSQPYALLPNNRTFTQNTTYTDPYTDPAGPGGANEDYDAPDYQNMLMALMVPMSGTPNVAIPIPSLHRPSLVNYWFHQFTWPPKPGGMSDAEYEITKLKYFMQPYGADNIISGGVGDSDGDLTTTTPMILAEMNSLIALRRRIIMRPLSEDHPDFTGSNENFNPIWDGVTASGYQWDVDNDGDGIMDSIWVDVGLPVRTMRDGRQYKPLVAILCVDMDGCINLNAHGNMAQAEMSALGGLDPEYPAYVYANPTEYPTNIITGGTDLNGNGSWEADVIRGQGVGPAEISLRALFNSSGNQATALCRRLLSGESATMTAGRYGESYGWNSAPGISGTTDELSSNRKLDFPQEDRLGAENSRSYGTPVGIKGTTAISLDLRGQPLYESLAKIVNLSTDDPYEFNLSRGSAYDKPFSPAELETLLRPFDADAGILPSRLSNLLLYDPINNIDGLAIQNLYAIRHIMTTDSWSLPCPALTLIIDRSTSPPTQKNFSHISEILTFSAPGKGVSPDQIYNLISPDLLAGLRMDLNRAFGDSRDNNGNSVIDEPGETTGNLVRQWNISTGLPYTHTDGADIPLDLNNGIDVNNDGIVDNTDSLLARQLYARHLYVLAMAVVDVEGIKFTLTGTPAEKDAAAARIIAQWAVNVVDFRDRDSIMTGFEYDVYPFDFDSATAGTNPWEVNGDLLTTEPPVAGTVKSGVVWGCERPELLITETLTFHDRRTEDLDAGGGTLDNENVPNADGTVVKDFDQRVQPEGSLFVELFNPWTSNEPLPAEFSFDHATTTLTSGVILNQVTPAAEGSHPVWRLAIAEQADIDLDPDDPDPSKRPAPYERSVYFVDTSSISGFNPSDEGQAYYPGTSPSGVVRPGQYAVIGPAAKTYIGERSDSVTGDTTRYIELDASSTPPISVIHNRHDMADTNDFPDADSVQQTPVTVIVDSPRRLSVSEPVVGYTTVGFDGSVYNPPLDEPLDAADTVLMQTNTTEAYRVIHLQRLANPLLAYDPDTNPYLTIDSMPIGITAFNGKSATDDGGVAGTVKFHSRQRGDSGSTGADMNIWSTVDNSSVDDSLDPDQNKIDSHRFDFFLKHTLGYLNDPFHYVKADDTDPTSFTVGWSKFESDGTTLTNVPATYYGAPRGSAGNLTFPWITWSNRPFINSKELLLVPSRRSSQLLANFTLKGSPHPYIDKLVPDLTTTPNASFAHMPNFFQSTDGTTDAAGFHRVLEFLRVPSPFVGTQLQATPDTFGDPANTNTHYFHPPFNYIAKYREPGRVNINTITSPKVWQGVINDVNSPPRDDMTTWGEVMNSRRGYALTTSNLFEMNPAYPTRFASPFRTSAGFYLVPDISASGKSFQTDIIKTEVNATILRADGVPETANPAAASNPLFRLTNYYNFNDPTRNLYFRYQPLHRLDNMLTTRSNVYKVWVTVGYFEVTAAPTGKPKIYPDGFQLGQELGSDTGDVTRHRSFYMIDRSIPVGFKRGEDLNSGDAILLRRFIE